MRAATVVQQLCKSCRTCFTFYCMFYFTCDRSFKADDSDRPAWKCDDTSFVSLSFCLRNYMKILIYLA